MKGLKNKLFNINDDADMYVNDINKSVPNTPKFNHNGIFHMSDSVVEINPVWHCHVQGSEDVNIKALRNHSARFKLISVTALCLIFMIAEIVGGVLAGSLAIQTDAAHMATDLAGFLLSLFAIHMSNKDSTRRMTFGFYRTEIIGALASTLLIWVLTGILVYLAILRIINDDYKIEPKFMIITASCGVFFNVLMAIVLHSNISGFNVS
jgi:zinc transporter 2